MYDPSPVPVVAGIVLCGGRSSRMGTPKHLLPFGNETVLQRVVRVLGTVVSPVVVVGSPEQPLSGLPAGTLVARDDEAHLGPLSGLATGLAALDATAEAVYLSGCDAPLLKPAFVRLVIDLLRPEDDAVVPEEDRFLHPLASVYRARLLPVARELLRRSELRPRTLLEAISARRIPVAQLRSVDPDLDSLRNMNSPAEYAALLQKCDQAAG